MTISEALLPEFDYEVACTRKTLERLPEDKFDWKPHPKSATLGALATHLAGTLTWAVKAIETDSIDVGASERPAALMSRAAVLATFDKNVIAARAAIAKASDEHLRQSWSFLMEGKQMFSVPRIAALRSFVISHSIHHRAQLGVYLRMNDIPVPAIYGPSADDTGMK